MKKLETTVEVLFKPEILSDFMGKFTLSSDFKKLGDFENYVYEVYRGGEPLILRVTHSSHRKEEDIISELDWMNYLNKHGVECPIAYKSSRSLLVESLAAEDGSEFYACLYSKVPGHAVKVRSEEFNEHLFRAWGKAIGKMHALTKEYQPGNKVVRRPSWHEEELLDIEKYDSNETVIQNTKQLLAELHSLPCNQDNFGLLHTDLHTGNFFFDGEIVHVFDFDDCAYHWFASDIAIPLYYSLLYGWPDSEVAEKEQFSSAFLKHFLEGYQQHNDVPKNLMEHIPLFFRLRDVTIYSVLLKKIPPEKRNERLQKMIEEIRTRILLNKPIVELS